MDYERNSSFLSGRISDSGCFCIHSQMRSAYLLWIMFMAMAGSKGDAGSVKRVGGVDLTSEVMHDGDPNCASQKS